MIIKRKLSLTPLGGVTALATSESVVVCNLGFYPVYVGDRDVSALNGFSIDGGKAYSFDLELNKPLYAIAPIAADVLILETLPHDAKSVPQNINLAAELGGEIQFIHSAHVVTAISQLPASPPVGELAQLQIGSWPSVETIDLICYLDVSSGLKYWISDAFSLITQVDQGYMGSNTATDDYIDTNVTGTTTGILGWTTRSVRRTNEILAAGLKLQANMTAIVAGTAAGLTFTLLTYFFQHNNGDQVVFSADGSTRDAESASIVSNADNLVRFKSTGWNDVVKKATATPITSADIIKTNLWPRLYGRLSSASGSYGSEIDADLQYRWYVPAA